MNVKEQVADTLMYAYAFCCPTPETDEFVMGTDSSDRGSRQIEQSTHNHTATTNGAHKPTAYACQA